MLDRINLIMKSRNLNAAQFADEIGVQRSSVSHILTGRNNASLDFMLKVLQRYPEIDTDWLLTGKGVMMRATSLNAVGMSESKKSETIVSSSGIPANEMTGDLFKQNIDIQDVKKNELQIEDKTVYNTNKQNINAVTEEEAQKKPDEEVKKTNSARHVEKIVIFYSDKTFVDYKPEINI